MSLTGYYESSYPPSVWGGGVPDPSITSLAPNTAVAGSGVMTVTVNGTDFIAGSVIEVNQAPIATTYVSATRLTGQFNPAVAGTYVFTVRNGGSGGEESNPQSFTVTPVQEEPQP